MAVTTMDPESPRTPQPQSTLGQVPGPSSLLPAGGVGEWLGPHGKHYACGSMAAFTNIVVTFPMQKVLFRSSSTACGWARPCASCRGTA